MSLRKPVSVCVCLCVSGRGTEIKKGRVTEAAEQGKHFHGYIDQSDNPAECETGAAGGADWKETGKTDRSGEMEGRRDRRQAIGTHAEADSRRG